MQVGFVDEDVVDGVERDVHLVEEEEDDVGRAELVLDHTDTTDASADGRHVECDPAAPGSEVNDAVAHPLVLGVLEQLDEIRVLRDAD